MLINQKADFGNGDQDFRPDMPQYSEEGMKKTRKLLDIIEKYAKEKNATNAQISLAWMMCKKDYIIPIPGSRKVSRLKENFDAGQVILTKEEVKALDDQLDTMDFLVFGGH